MTMSNNGLTKLIEECGELTQIAAKKIAYPDTDAHPDGEGSMKERLEDEVADVMAAIAFVAEKFKLDEGRMFARGDAKRKLYQQWDDNPEN
jgi:NTP pyrophosphatase (non-canonical NTP hydrolase)